MSIRREFTAERPRRLSLLAEARLRREAQQQAAPVVTTAPQDTTPIEADPPAEVEAPVVAYKPEPDPVGRPPLPGVPDPRHVAGNALFGSLTRRTARVRPDNV